MSKKKAIRTEEAAAVQPAQAETAPAKEKKPRKVLNTIINVVLIIAIVVAAICTYVSFVSTSGNGVPNIFGLRILSIQTDSMYPFLKPGDLILDTGVKDTSELRKEDVITYWTVINGERVLNTHRIENIYDGGGYLIFETKGDNNTSADPLTVHESEIVGQYKAKIPGLGKVFDYLQTSTGFLIVVVVPVFIFFIYHLVQFFRVLFEYQTVKNRIKFEEEHLTAESDADDEAKKEEEQAKREAERAAMEAEIREQLRAELMASMKQEAAGEQPATAPEPAPAEQQEAADEQPVTTPESAPVEQTESAPAADKEE